ncbi:MAG TPA: metallophosphoesterase [Gammaproteobacteria bacterium]
MPSAASTSAASALARVRRTVAAAACAALAACAYSPARIASADRIAAAVGALELGGRAAVLVGAGDIARCDEPQGARATAEIVAAVVAAAPDAIVFTAGDHAYEHGSALQFRECYDPLWGRFNARTFPTPGNHDYETAGAVPYFDYFDVFDVRPEARPTGYYSFDAGGWLVVALNSMLRIEPGAVQVRWLERTLAEAAGRCILAFWHHPLASSGFHGFMPWDPGRDTAIFWERLARHGGDVVVNGHDHLYERFAPRDAEGRAAAGGMRQFTVGTGGGGLHPIIWRRRDSVFATDETYGVLVLMLEPTSYEWAFIGADGIVHDRSDGPVACAG